MTKPGLQIVQLAFKFIKFIYTPENRKIKIKKKQEKIEFVKNLNNIGYCFPTYNKSFFVKTVKAFQRHYRKELINGLVDRECLIIAQNLSKNL